MVATIGEVRLKVSLDRSDVRSGIEELRQIQAPKIALKPKVDASELHELNRLFDVKIAHAGLLQQRLNFKAHVDTSQLTDLSRQLDAVKSTTITIAAKVVVDRSALSQVADREITIRTKFESSGGGAGLDTTKLSDEISAAITKGFESAKGGGLGDLLLAPIRGALGLATGVLGAFGQGLVNGLTEPITAGLGKGLTAAIESALAPSIGSSELFANKVGTAIGTSIVDAAKIELADLNDAIQASIDNIDNGRVRRKLQSVLDSVRSAPSNINQAVQETIGADNITRQNLLNDRRSGQQSKRDDRLVQAQAQQEFDTAKSTARQLSRQPRTTETDALIQQQIAVAEVANQFRAKRRNLPDQFVQVAQAVGGKNVDVDRLPSLRADDAGLSQLGANASYDRESNVISIRSSLKDSLEKANLSNEEIRTLAEELSHAFDLDFGSERGLSARSRGQVLPDRRLEATPDELRRITPELSRYNEADRGFELNGKIRAERATAQVLLEQQQGDMLRLIGDIRQSADLQPLIDKYKKIAQIGSSLGVDLGGSLRDDFLAVETLASDTIGGAAAGDIQGDALKAAIGGLDSAFAALQTRIDDRAKQLSSIIEDRQIERGIADPFNTPELPEGSVNRLIDRASGGPQIYPQVRDPFLPPPSALDRAKEIGGRVKDAVFNPDRNIDIDIDGLRDQAEAVGIILYKAGMVTAKAFDVTAKTFNQLAASPIGQSILGAAGDTGQALGAAAKATYALASGVEAITLDLIPAGRTLKAGLKQTAVPALAFGAATQLLPGGQALAGAGVDLAQAALGPAGGAISTNLIASANQALAFLPDAFGMQAAAIEAVTTLITSATSTITAGVAEIAVPILGGKLITGSIGKALPAGGARQQAALAPGRDASAAAERAGEIAASAVSSARLVARTTDDIVSSAKEIQARVSVGYGALKDAIAGGNKDFAKALQQSIADTTERAQKDLNSLLDEARSSGNQSALVEIGQVKGRINRNFNSARRLDRRVDAIDVGAEDITGEGLARASGEAKPSVFSQLKNRLNSLLPLTDKRLAAIGDNYERIIQAIGEVSDATVGFDSGDIVPGLRVADRALKELGAEAFYDAKSNVILINKELASILANGPEELKKYADKLRPLVQEGRHALQTVGGGLDIASAATGANVTLDRGDNLSAADRRQVERSVGAARGNADPNAVRRLETDALAFEAKTSRIVGIAAEQARKEAGPSRPIDGLKQRLEQLRDAIKDRVLGIVGQAKATVEQSKALIPIGLTSRVAAPDPLTAEDNAAIADRLGRGQTRAQRQADSARAEIDSGRRAGRRSIDADESFRSAERRIARDSGGVASTGTVSLREDGDQTIGLFKGIKGIVKSFNDRLAAELKETSAVLAQDAAQTVLEIRNSRVQAENSGDRVAASRLGGLEQRAESAIGGIDALREQPLTDPKQREKLRGLRDEIGAVYDEIQRPLPTGGGDGLLGIGDSIGGLIGKFKGLGATLLALPFAFEALQGLRQFARDSVEAAVSYDRLRTSLANSSGSVRAADRDLAFVDQSASTFGTDLRTGREGFTQLRAATRGTGVQGKPTEDLFTGVTQAATVLGLSGDAQNRAFLALQQTASKGKVSAEELRQQLAEALPGAFGIAARSIGVTEAELNKLLETGAITSDEFLPKFGRQLKAEFGGSAVEASNNLQSSLFRVDAAFLKLKESSGAGVAPAVQIGANAATGALELLNRSIGVIGPALALLAGKTLLEMGRSLLGIPAAAKLATAGLGALKTVAMSVGASLGPIAALSLAVLAAGKIYEGLKETFNIDPSVAAFKSGTAQIASELDVLVGKTEKANKAIGAFGKKENKGLDLTFGLGEVAGAGRFKTDDLVDLTRSQSLGDRVKGEALAFAGGPVTQILAATGFKSSEFAARREAEANTEAIGNIDRISNTIDEGNSGTLRTDALRRAKEIDDRAAAVRTNLARLRGRPGTETETAKQQDELSRLGRERRDAIAPAEAQQQQLSASLRELQARRKALEEAPPSKARTGALDEIDQKSDRVRKQLEKLRNEEIAIGVNVDPVRKLVTALADLESKLSSIEAKANLTLNIKLAGNARDSLAEFGGNQFASQDLAVKDAEAQSERVRSVFAQTKAEVEKARQELSGEDTTRALSQIGVGGTGRVISIDSSEEDIKTASKGASGQQKELLDRVDSFRKTRESLPVLDRDAAQAELGERQSRQSGALARFDDQSEVRSLGNAKSAGDRQIALNKEIANNSIKSDEALAVRRATLDQQSVTDRASAVSAQISSLEELKSRGVLSAEEYTKRRRALAQEEVGIATEASNAELAVRQAANAEALKGFERAKAVRDLDARSANNEGRVALIGRQLSGPRKLESEDVAIASAQLDISATDRQAANAQQDLLALSEQLDRGLIKATEFEDKSRELKGTLSDLGAQKAANELALLEAQNAKVLKSFERLNAEANASLDARSFTRSDSAKRSQFETGEVTGLGGAAEQSAIEREAIEQRIKLRSGEIAGVKRLVQQRVLSESEGRDRILGIEADIRGQRTQLLDSQIAEFTRATDARIAAAQRAGDAEQREFTRQKTRLEQSAQLIERESALLNARRDLAGAIGSGRVAALEGRSAAIGEQRNLAARLRSGDAGANERKEIERQIGRPGFAQSGAQQELELLDRQQALSREIESEKLSGLEEQQKFARDSLNLEERRLEIAQRIAEIEAKGGEAQARVELAKSKLELAKTRSTGDRDQIAAATDVVRANEENLGAAQERRQAIGGLRGSLSDENDLKRRSLGVTQRNDLDAAFRDGNANELKRRLERASLGDTLGINTDTDLSLSPRRMATSEETNRSLYSEQSTTATTNADYQAQQLAIMQKMLEVAIVTSGKLDKPAINNFNGGEGSIDQYIALQQQLQASKSRSR